MGWEALMRMGFRASAAFDGRSRRCFEGCVGE
jgi:hypothetical protein